MRTATEATCRSSASRRRLRRFLALLEDVEKKKTKWSIRQTSPGELISVLLGPCGQARWVALDTLPSLTFVARAMLPLMRVKRELFVKYLMEGRKERSGEVVAAYSGLRED